MVDGPHFTRMMIQFSFPPFLPPPIWTKPGPTTTCSRLGDPLFTAFRTHSRLRPARSSQLHCATEHGEGRAKQTCSFSRRITRLCVGSPLKDTWGNSDTAAPGSVGQLPSLRYPAPPPPSTMTRGNQPTIRRVSAHAAETSISLERAKWEEGHSPAEVRVYVRVIFGRQSVAI